jgi:hypothetical protein
MIVVMPADEVSVSAACSKMQFEGARSASRHASARALLDFDSRLAANWRARVQAKFLELTGTSGDPHAPDVHLISSKALVRCDHMSNVFGFPSGTEETLVNDLAALGGLPGGSVHLVGETSLADLKTRPDFAVTVGNALVGFIEVKAPGVR